MPREPVIMVSNCAHLTLNIPNGQMCLECGDDFEESNHIRSITKCAKCKYQTACSRAILDHTTHCNFTVKNSEPPAPFPLEKEWFCICGYSSSEGMHFHFHGIIFCCCCCTLNIFSMCEIEIVRLFFICSHHQVMHWHVICRHATGKLHTKVRKRL